VEHEVHSDPRWGGRSVCDAETTRRRRRWRQSVGTVTTQTSSSST
jgi:hypothetical protein